MVDTIKLEWCPTTTINCSNTFLIDTDNCPPSMVKWCPQPEFTMYSFFFCFLTAKEGALLGRKLLAYSTSLFEAIYSLLVWSYILVLDAQTFPIDNS